MNYTKSFSQVSKEDVITVGGKGASLGELLHAGMPVPPGFVVLSSAYDRFKDEGKMPSDIAEEIKKGFTELNTQRVAVRSSATAEDSRSASWAGQLDSYLNTTEDTLLENVQKCWESLESARSKFYRSEQGLADAKISVAVVIQEMIESEVAGTAFSVHPVTEDANQVIIEAGLGLGEAVVGGTITPDMYVVAKDRRSIVEKKLHAQGTFTEQKVSDEHILKLAELVIAIEKHYGFPVDVEWAFANEKFYIVQSRPITTLAHDWESKTIYRKLESRSIFLMACEIWDEGERVILPQMTNGVYTLDPLSEYQKGLGVATFYNFTDPAQAPGQLFAHLTSNRDFLTGQKGDFDILCDEIRELTACGTKKDFEKLRDCLIRILPIISIGILVANWDCRDKDTLSTAIRIREESDDVLHSGLEKLMQMAEDLLPRQYKKWVEYLLFDEIRSGKLPSEDELARRKEGYVYHKGTLHTKTLIEYALENNLEIQDYDGKKYSVHEEMADTLTGTTACPGKQKGRVVLVFERADIGKVRMGDILVTAMTTPNLSEAMKRASAFVTDEGGITCHAAIVARELGKPCIIGTKIATRTLHDGDLVEVDADTGMVRILSPFIQ